MPSVQHISFQAIFSSMARQHNKQYYISGTTISGRYPTDLAIPQDGNGITMSLVLD